MLTREQVYRFYQSIWHYKSDPKIEKFLEIWLTSDMIQHRDRKDMAIISELAPEEFRYTGKIYRGIGKYHGEKLELNPNISLSWTTNYQVARRFARMVEGWSLEDGEGHILTQHSNKSFNLTKFLQHIYPTCGADLKNVIDTYCNINYEIEIIDSLREYKLQTFQVVNNNLIIQ